MMQSRHRFPVRRWASRTGVTGLGLATLLTACSLFVGLDGLGDGPAEDAGSSAETSTATDARLDDGGASVVDGGNDADAAGPECLNDPSHLCDDFEALPGAWWTDQILKGDGGVTLDQSAYVSPPSSLLTTVPAGSFGASKAALARTFSGPRAGMSCTFAVRADQLATDRVAAFTIDSRFPTGALIQHVITLRLKPTSSEVGEFVDYRDGGTDTKTYDLGTFSVASATGFRTFSVDLSFSSGAGATTSVRVLVDGVERANSASGYAVPTDFTDTTVSVGITGAESSAPTILRVDDVRCEQR